jgi:hypothetical protein
LNTPFGVMSYVNNLEFMRRSHGFHWAFWRCHLPLSIYLYIIPHVNEVQRVLSFILFAPWMAVRPWYYISMQHGDRGGFVHLSDLRCTLHGPGLEGFDQA